MSGELPIQAALVTGAGHGIGREVALHLGQRGVQVACVSRTGHCRRTAASIRQHGGSATPFVLDLADFRQAERVLRSWADSIAPSRVAVILAAAVLGPAADGTSFDLAAWENTFHVNVLGNLAAVNALLPGMLASRFGRIVFFSGGGAALPLPVFPAYGASKIAIARIVEDLHHQLAPRGDFAVVSLAPGSNPTRTLDAVRAAGGTVRTLCAIGESVDFVVRFLSHDVRGLSGRLVHVRDDWSELSAQDTRADHWTLRRVQR